MAFLSFVRVPKTLSGSITFVMCCAALAHPAYGQASVVAGDLKVEATYQGHHVTSVLVHDGVSGRNLHLAEAFSIFLSDGSRLDSSKLETTAFRSNASVEDPHEAFRASTDTAATNKVCWNFAAPDRGLSFDWCLIARSGTQYVRELLRITASAKDAPISEVRLLDFASADAKVEGKLKSSPIVAGNMFFGFEHPLSTSVVDKGNAQASLFRSLPLKANQSITYSAVIGSAPVGQLRRSFLDYLESERPRRYQAFLHYNSWYDIGYTNRFSEADVLDRIHVFGDELTVKRHVKMDSFLLDDGWDDTHNLWAFNTGFKDGLRVSSKAAAAYGFGLGLWLSPWGGYGNEKLERLAYGREHGYEILNDGYALSGPKYFNRFEQTCLDMVKQYDVNQFKFDGTGNADRVFPGSSFDSDFDAAIHLIEDLRRQKPDIFINLTTGTTASPFWVFYADSIWRGGEDHDFTGVGTARQRWITYRDAQTYKNIVQQGPLFPLNSLMLHGIVYAKLAKDLDTDPKNDFPDEVHSYFGTGTQTQEMYITPSLLSQANWDTLADAARWSRDHRDVLKDVHWMGGDPEKLQVYGWAAWSPKLGILTLRNPLDRPQSFSVDIAKAFELASSLPQNYRLHTVWKSADAQKFDESTLNSQKSLDVRLAPFEVITLEATPTR